MLNSTDRSGGAVCLCRGSRRFSTSQCAAAPFCAWPVSLDTANDSRWFVSVELVARSVFRTFKRCCFRVLLFPFLPFFCFTTTTVIIFTSFFQSHAIRFHFFGWPPHWLVLFVFHFSLTVQSLSCKLTFIQFRMRAATFILKSGRRLVAVLEDRHRPSLV